MIGKDQGPATSRKAARINTGNLVGRGFREALLAEITRENKLPIFATNLQLEVTMSPGCVLREHVDYISIEEDGSLTPVILRPTLTHDWKPIGGRPVIAPEDRMRLHIACRMLEKVGPLNGQTISHAEMVYICLGGNQHTNGSVKGFPTEWNEERRKTTIDYVNRWHQRFLAGEDQPVSTNPDCANICPFGDICTKQTSPTSSHQLSFDRVLQ